LVFGFLCSFWAVKFIRFDAENAACVSKQLSP